MDGDNQIYTATNDTPVMPAQRQEQSAQSSGSGRGMSVSFEELGIYHERPKHMEMAVLSKRIETFEGWPEESRHINPLDLAKAGFYYAGYGDTTKCFHCNGNLRNWERGDNPFIEHAKHFPHCGYIRQFVGQAFVGAVQEREQRGLQQYTYDDIMRDLRSRGIDVPNTLDQCPVEQEIAVRSMLDEGYPKVEVVQAAERLRDEGVPLTVTELFKRIHQQPAIEGEPLDTEADGHGGMVVSSETEELSDQNMDLRQNLTCKICMDREVKMVFLPCGHLVCCQECSIAFKDCPVCRGPIRACVKATYQR